MYVGEKIAPRVIKRNKLQLQVIFKILTSWCMDGRFFLMLFGIRWTKIRQNYSGDQTKFMIRWAETQWFKNWKPSTWKSQMICQKRERKLKEPNGPEILSFGTIILTFWSIVMCVLWYHHCMIKQYTLQIRNKIWCTHKGHQLMSSQLWRDPIYTYRDIQMKVYDTLRVFSGDGPSRQFEAGQQRGGNFSCLWWVSVKEHQNLECPFRCYIPSLSERYSIFRAGELWQIFQTLVPLFPLLITSEKKAWWISLRLDRMNKSGMQEEVQSVFHGIHYSISKKYNTFRIMVQLFWKKNYICPRTIMCAYMFIYIINWHRTDRTQPNKVHPN